MAIFHLSAVIHSRSKGHSAIAGAAYRSRSEMIDERTGERHDYSRKSAEVLFAGMYAPKDAPEWTQDRAQLWQHVEAFEKRRDAQLARVFDIALPHELTLEQNRRLLQDWVRDNFTRKGLIADVVIHAPDRGGDQRNTHAHVAVVLRKLDGTEFAAKKERTETASERLGQLEGWRESWEKTANRHLERAGSDQRIDRRTLKEQGIDAEPGKHVGPTANKMERDGKPSDRGANNQDIAERNAERQKLAKLEAEERKLTAEIIDLKAERARREARGGERDRYDSLRDTHRDVARDQYHGPGRYDDLKAKPPPAPSAFAKATADKEDMRPLGKTAGDIRMAWSLTRGTGDLEEALAARGVTLARTTPEEARQSERTAAFVKEVSNFARVLREGETVAVDARGNVYRLDTRTTGDERQAIEGRTAGLDLLSVTDAKEAMIEAAREARSHERRAAWEKAQPATGIEKTIAEAFKSTMTGHEFAAAIDDAGLTIARATEADVKALDALRQDARLAAAVAHTEAEPDRVRYFAKLEAGDYAAVTRAGDVFRLNPHQVDLEGAGQRLADTQSRLPSITEARALVEINREGTADLWAERRASNSAADAARAEAIEARESMRDMGTAADRGADQVLDVAGEALDLGSKAAGGLASKFAKFVENMLEGVFGFFGAGEVKLSPQQAELEGKAAEAHAPEHAIAAEEAEKQATIERIIFEQDRKQQQDKLHAELYGRFPDLTLDPNRNPEPERERERERD